MTPTTNLASDIRPPFRWDLKRRFLLRCELDAAFFQLCGVTSDNAAYIRISIPSVRHKNEVRREPK
jgi:hypothetical protein